MSWGLVKVSQRRIYDVVYHLPYLFINTELRLEKCVPIKGDMMYFLPCSKTHSSPWTKKKTALNLSLLLLPLPFFHTHPHTHTHTQKHTYTHTLLLYTVVSNLLSTTIAQHFGRKQACFHSWYPNILFQKTTFDQVMCDWKWNTGLGRDLGLINILSLQCCSSQCGIGMMKKSTI